jgi:hypothetical protein
VAGPLAEQHVREFVRSCVRAGLLDDHALHEEVVLAVSTELPDVPKPESLARQWVAEFRDELHSDADSWPEVTDYHRLQGAFADLEDAGIVVLQGCEDHWSAKAVLDERSSEPPRGIAWFTPPDVWHAIDEGMLELNVWHGDTANVAPGDDLLDHVVAVLARHGLAAHFDEGRVEVSAHWQRPPTMRS